MLSWSRPLGPDASFSTNYVAPAYVALSCIIIFLLLAGTQALHCPICAKNRHGFCFPHNERIKKHSKLVCFDLHHSLLVKVIKIRCENCRCCAHFVLLGVNNVFHLVTGQLKDGLEVCIDDKRCLSTTLYWLNLIFACFELGTGSIGALTWSRLGCKAPSVAQGFLRWKVTEAPITKMLLGIVFFNIWKQMRDAGNWCIVILLIKLIGHRLVDFTADHQRMSSATFIIKER